MPSYSNLLNDISNGNVESLELVPTRREVKVLYKDRTKDTVPIFPNDQTILRLSQETGTQLTVNYLKSEQARASLIGNLGFIVIFILLLLFILRKTLDVANRSMGFLAKQNQVSDSINLQTRFEDVAGVNEALDEIKEIVSFLKEPEAFEKIGARIPKGFLLVGPPGTGKTLLAKAIAGEANVPFFSLAASEFVELFIGVGASRVRSLFKEAKLKSPSIIFIDEIDAIGRQRGSGIGGGNDEREQTLNQLLTEIDGFADNSGVVILAATNRADILDNALIRPGRFDRTVNINLPDRKGRLDILNVHARSKPLSPEVSLNNWAIRTPGFSGADLNNLLNEAAILTARNNKTKISDEELDQSFDRLTLGLMTNPRKYSDHKKIIAYHEIGKAIVGAHLPTQEKLDKISILPRSSDLGGNIRFLPEEEFLDNALYTKKYLKYTLIRGLAGRAAEMIVFGEDEVTQIAASQLSRMTSLAREMITRYGFGDISFISIEDSDSQVSLGQRLISNKNSIAENTNKNIDKEVIRLLKNSLQESIDILTPFSEMMDKLVDILIEEETMDSERFYKLSKLPYSKV